MPVEMMLQFFSVIVCLRFFISHAKNKYTQNIDHSHSCGQSHFNKTLWYAPFYETKFDFGLFCKGQIISECPYEKIVCPKIATKKFPRFLS